MHSVTSTRELRFSLIFSIAKHKLHISQFFEFYRFFHFAQSRECKTSFSLTEPSSTLDTASKIEWKETEKANQSLVSEANLSVELGISASGKLKPETPQNRNPGASLPVNRDR